MVPWGSVTGSDAQPLTSSEAVPVDLMGYKDQIYQFTRVNLKLHQLDLEFQSHSSSSKWL